LQKITVIFKNLENKANTEDLFFEVWNHYALEEETQMFGVLSWAQKSKFLFQHKW